MRRRKCNDIRADRLLDRGMRSPPFGLAAGGAASHGLPGSRQAAGDGRPASPDDRNRPAAGQNGSLAIRVGEYLDAHRGVFTDATIAAKRRALGAFVDWAGKNTAIGDVSWRTAAEYVDRSLRRNGSARKSNDDRISHLKAFWTFAIERGIYDRRNPWTGQALALRRITDGPEKTVIRRAWTHEELKTVFSEKSDRPNVWLAGVLALYTGARPGELSHTQLWQVDLRSATLYMYDAGTRLPVRMIPIHPVIYPLVAKQCGRRANDYLVHDEQAVAARTDRSRLLSRRFTHWLREDRKVRDKGVVFQSLRNTFIDAALRAGVQESLVKLLVAQGRRHSTGRFTSNAIGTVLADAVARISFGEIDRIVRELT